MGLILFVAVEVLKTVKIKLYRTIKTVGLLVCWNTVRGNETLYALCAESA
jgi:hypothetical protein